MSVLHQAIPPLSRFQCFSAAHHRFTPRYGVKNPNFQASFGVEFLNFAPSALPNSISHASPVSSFSEVKKMGSFSFSFYRHLMYELLYYFWVL